MKDQPTKERFIELRANGWSFDRIAKELKVSKQTLVAWSKELTLEIANLRAIELEALQEKYFLLKGKRIELFGEKLKTIREELDKRNLKDVPTEKLFDLLLKCFAVLEREAVETVFQEETDNPLPSFTEVKSWKA
jgi:DNA-binding XRE family transcriptional regulator